MRSINPYHPPTRSSGIEKRIVSWLDEDITVELDVPEVIKPQLEARLQRRRDVEWLGIIRLEKGNCGALGRLRATGTLVEVFGRSISILRPQLAALVSAALDEEIRAIMQEHLGGNDAKNCERSDGDDVLTGTVRLGEQGTLRR